MTTKEGPSLPIAEGDPERQILALILQEQRAQTEHLRRVKGILTFWSVLRSTASEAVVVLGLVLSTCSALGLLGSI